MSRRYWLPALVLGILGLFFFFLVYSYQFTGVLLLAFALLVAVFGTMDALKKRFPRLMKHLRRIVYCCLALIFVSAVVTGVFIAGGIAGAEDAQADYVIVLGAAVVNDAPSVSLRERLEAAKNYLERHPDSIAILTGGLGDGDTLSEAECMYRWLTERGIDESRLRKEERATSTGENIALSMELIAAETGERPARIAVVSSEYHLYRAGLIGEREGVTVLGCPAHTSSIPFFCNMFLREIGGVWFHWVLG